MVDVIWCSSPLVLDNLSNEIASIGTPIVDKALKLCYMSSFGDTSISCTSLYKLVCAQEKFVNSSCSNFLFFFVA